MLDNEPNDTTTTDAAEPPKKAPRRRATKAAAAPEAAPATDGSTPEADGGTTDTGSTPEADGGTTDTGDTPEADGGTTDAGDTGDAAPKKATKRAPAKKAAPRKKVAAKADSDASTGTDSDASTGTGTASGTEASTDPVSEEVLDEDGQPISADGSTTPAPAAAPPARPARRRATSPSGPAFTPEPAPISTFDTAPGLTPPGTASDEGSAAPRRRTRAPAVIVTFQAPEAAPAVATAASDDTPAPRTRRRAGTAGTVSPVELLAETTVEEDAEGVSDDAAETDAETDEDGTGPRRRRRGRRGRGGARRPEGEGEGDEPTEGDEEPAEGEEGTEEDDDSPAGTRRRRRRRRSGGGGGAAAEGDDDVPTVVHVREPGSRDGAREGAREGGRDGGRDGGGQQRQRAPRTRDGNRDGGNAADEDGVRGISGSTRMAAKRVRRQEGRDSGRKRAPILSEAEFLARREAVDRQMVVRQKGDRTQIAVLEDGILVEHYVTKASATSYAGNVYLGRVQNVLPSMEAAFVDVGKGRNAVLYAGEVNWDGVAGGSRKIEQVLKGGQEVLVQVSKDPIGHKGARLTSQINLPGRYLVYVPDSNMTGISRKLPENERTRLKNILRNVVPETAGVIIRTAAEGVSEEEIAKDVRRLQAQWEVISTKAAQGGGPKLLHAEPDLVIKVVRDIFNEDFTSLVVQGESEWDTIREYVGFVAPDLAPRLSKFAGNGDVFAEHRIDEQLLKALDRKVYLPSGGSLVIDRTEAMVVVDVNTGKYVGKGGNLEETVTRNNLEAAEEIARQLRLRDLGGIIVVDFIDMVLESNRDLVVRRLVECLGRDRTKHQVAEVTSLGLVQMTRKRVGQGLLESFSETCEACNGRGVKVHLDPIEPRAERERDRSPKVGPKAPLPAGAPAPAGGPSSDSASEEGSGGGSRNRRRRGGRGQGSAVLDSAMDPSTELSELLGDVNNPLPRLSAPVAHAPSAPDAPSAARASDETAALTDDPSDVAQVVTDEPSGPDVASEEAAALSDDASAVAEEAEETPAVEMLADEMLADEVLAGEMLADEVLAGEDLAAAEVADESAVPAVKKRRRAVSRPAGAPTD